MASVKERHKRASSPTKIINTESFEWQLAEIHEVPQSLDSPVNLDIREASHLKLPNLAWHNYEKPPKKMKITNTGQTVVLSGKWFSERPNLTGGALTSRYVFSQIHFHWGGELERGSEHTVDGFRLPLEMHLVHFKAEYGSQDEALLKDDGLFVVSFFFKLQDDDNPVMSPVTDKLFNIARPHTSHNVALSPISSLVDAFTADYFSYWGAMCSDSCQHTILWCFPRTMLGISRQQMLQFQHLVNDDGWPLRMDDHNIHPLGKRRLFFVNPSESAHTFTLSLPIGTTRSEDLVRTSSSTTSSSASLGAEQEASGTSWMDAVCSPTSSKHSRVSPTVTATPGTAVSTISVKSVGLPTAANAGSRGTVLTHPDSGQKHENLRSAGAGGTDSDNNLRKCSGIVGVAPAKDQEQDPTAVTTPANNLKKESTVITTPANDQGQSQSVDVTAQASEKENSSTAGAEVRYEHTKKVSYQPMIKRGSIEELLQALEDLRAQKMSSKESETEFDLLISPAKRLDIKTEVDQCASPSPSVADKKGEVVLSQLPKSSSGSKKNTTDIKSKNPRIMGAKATPEINLSRKQPPTEPDPKTQIPKVLSLTSPAAKANSIGKNRTLGASKKFVHEERPKIKAASKILTDQKTPTTVDSKVPSPAKPATISETQKALPTSNSAALPAPTPKRSLCTQQTKQIPTKPPAASHIKSANTANDDKESVVGSESVQTGKTTPERNLATQQAPSSINPKPDICVESSAAPLTTKLSSPSITVSLAGCWKKPSGSKQIAKVSKGVAVKKGASLRNVRVMLDLLEQEVDAAFQKETQRDKDDQRYVDQQDMRRQFQIVDSLPLILSDDPESCSSLSNDSETRHDDDLVSLYRRGRNSDTQLQAPWHGRTNSPYNSRKLSTGHKKMLPLQSDNRFRKDQMVARIDEHVKGEIISAIQMGAYDDRSRDGANWLATKTNSLLFEAATLLKEHRQMVEVDYKEMLSDLPDCGKIVEITE